MRSARHWVSRRTEHTLSAHTLKSKPMWPPVALPSLPSVLPPPLSNIAAVHKLTLVCLGVQRGDRVAIISRNRYEWVLTAYAGYGIEAINVPMYEQQKKADWQYIVEDSDAKVGSVDHSCLMMTFPTGPDCVHRGYLQSSEGVGGQTCASDSNFLL